MPSRPSNVFQREWRRLFSIDISKAILAGEGGGNDNLTRSSHNFRISSQRGDRTAVRGGYSLVYDRVGAGIATSFDSGGSFEVTRNCSD